MPPTPLQDAMHETMMGLSPGSQTNTTTEYDWEFVLCVAWATSTNTHRLTMGVGANQTYVNA